MKKLFFAFLIFSATLSNAQEILSLKEQARVIDEITGERINFLLPQLMEQKGIDMWIIISREYNEDPIIKTFLPATWLSARRRTILVFYRNASTKQYEKLAIARYNVGEHIKSAWNPEQEPNQWKALMSIITQYNPNKIALNYSKNFAHADGLTYTDHQEFFEHLPTALKSKIVSAEPLAVAWLETRMPREIFYYQQLVQITHQIIAEGFSEKVIMPGVTTTDDVVWWFRQRIRNLGLDTWFHTSVAVQRNNPENFEHLRAFSNRPKDEVILPGDLLHVDIGITYLRLNTDIQEHAYVLAPGEKDVPKSIQLAFDKANRLQDILTQQFKIGKTGNQILADALKQAKSENIIASIYTHPLGLHGHAAGPTIGLWDQQNGVQGSGDYPLNYNTAYSIELNAASNIPEWKKSIRIMLEQDGFFDENGFRYISGRQKKIHVIPQTKATHGD